MQLMFAPASKKAVHCPEQHILALIGKDMARDNELRWKARQSRACREVLHHCAPESERRTRGHGAED